MSEVKTQEQVFTGTITLVSSEGRKFEVAAQIAAFSNLIKSIMDGIDDEDEDEDEDEEEEHEIPLPNVKTAVLIKVIEFCEYHIVNGPMQEIEKPLRSANMAENVGVWDAAFVEIDQALLFEIILASNYMDVKSLLDLTCAKVASMIKGKTPEEIRETFNITNDFTPEEEEQVRSENKWCEEA